MANFSLVKSPEEIVNAINGNGYTVYISPDYGSRKPSLNSINKHGLHLEYYNNKYPNKKYMLFVLNDIEIESHNVFNVRLIKHMFSTYGNSYLTLVREHIREVINNTAPTTDKTYKALRLKDDMKFYNDLYTEVKAEKAEEEKKKAEAEKAKGTKTEHNDEAE